MEEDLIALVHSDNRRAIGKRDGTNMRSLHGILIVHPWDFVQWSKGTRIADGSTNHIYRHPNDEDKDLWRRCKLLLL